MKRKLTAVLLALLMVLSLLPAVYTPKTAVADAQPVDQAIVQGGAILHCFDWSFDEIREALPDIKAAGYVAVQTSPVQPPKDYNASWNDTGGNWWKLYQPLDFCVVGENGSWLGSKADLIELCDAAAEQDIYVIVDVVANHTANITGGGYTVNGGTYNVSDQVAERLQDPDGSKNLYHTSENGTNDDSRYTMTQYHLSMPDLNTGNPEVQNMVLDFLKECVDCGVDGFRFDAAKHIELPGDSGCGSDFWPYVLNGVRDYAGANNLYIYGESLSGSGSDAWVNEFITYMGLTDSQAGNTARGAVVDQNAGLLAVSDYTRGNSPKDYVIWAESHDTYEDGGSTGVSSAKIIKTWGIVGARADSTALFLARPNERMGAASSDTAWKSPAVAAVNAFKNHYDGTGEWLSYDQDAKITWIERGTSGGDAGVSIVRLEGAGWVDLEAHLMSDGVYKDSVTGNTFGVQNGRIFGNVGPTGVAVVYETTTGELPTPPASTTRTLYLRPNSNWKQDGARFAVYAFGNGDHWYSMSAVDGEDGLWSAEISSSYPSVIFVRMNPSTTDNNWNNKWNQTGDLAVPSDKNLFTIAEGVWDGATTTWSAYGDVGGGDDPTPVTEDAGYYLAGTMTGWSISPEFKMTRTGAETEEYMIELPLLRTSKPYNSQFKVVYSPDGVTDQTWFPDGFDNNYGDYTGEIPQSGVYTVYFRPNYDGGDGWHDDCIYAERTKFFVTVNDADKNGTVTVDKDVAAAGETVTVTVTPNEGYELDTLVYMCETGFNTGEFDITEIDGNTFEMPAENAAVKATFKEAETVYTVILDPGDGTGDPIVYRSDEQEEILPWNETENLKFCYYDGSMEFRMDPETPCTFTAPQNCVFDKWSTNDLGKYIPLTDEVTTITALWKFDETAPASYELSPSEYTLAEEEYTDIECTLETLFLGKIYDDNNSCEVSARELDLCFYAGALSDGENSIPFKVAGDDHDNPGSEKYVGIFNEQGETFTVAVWIDPTDLAKAAPGTYTGSLNYGGTWYNFDEGFVLVDAGSGTIALTLTVAEKPAVPSFATQNLVLEGQIGVNFFMDLPEIAGVDYAESYMTFAVEHGSVNERDDYDPNAVSGGNYGFTAYVNALQMAEPITATFHWFEGEEEKTVEKTYSVEDYLAAFDAAVDEGKITDAKLIALVHALADYGYYIQRFMAEQKGWTLGEDYAEMETVYETDYDFNAITAGVADYAIERDHEDPDIKATIPFSVKFDSAMAATVQFSTKKSYAGVFTATVNGEAHDVVHKGTKYNVEIANIAAHQLSRTYEIIVTTDNGTATVRASVLSYVKLMLEAFTDNVLAQNAAAAIYAYSQAADAYKEN